VLTQTQLRALLDERGLAPRKQFGQNFLIDRNQLDKLLDAANVGAGDVIFEVGPGAGTLTRPLLERGARVVAVEIDRGLAQLLRDTLAPDFPGTFTLIEGDALNGPRAINIDALRALGGGPCKLVANLPYGAATPLMMTLLVSHENCREQHVTIQKEVAQRLTASPRTKEYGELTVVAHALAEVTFIQKSVPPRCFWPPPKVTSAMVSVVRRDRPLVNDPHALVRACDVLFGRRRKQIGAILGREFPLPEGIAPTDRAEALAPEQVIALAESMRD